MLKRGAVTFIFMCSNLLYLQPIVAQSEIRTENKSNPPFQVLTSGKKITIQAKQNIQSVMVWTSAGHRLVEEKEINATAYSFNITISEKIFYVRVDMADGKMYTKKIGVQ